MADATYLTKNGKPDSVKGLQMERASGDPEVTERMLSLLGIQFQGTVQQTTAGTGSDTATETNKANGSDA